MARATNGHANTRRTTMKAQSNLRSTFRNITTLQRGRAAMASRALTVALIALTIAVSAGALDGVLPAAYRTPSALAFCRVRVCG